MKVLERERGSAIPGLTEVDFLANLLILTSKIPGFSWRQAGPEDYQKYLAKTPRPKITQEITDLLQGKPYGVLKTFVPQHKLESLLPGFQQFTVWSLFRELGLPEIRQILDQAFPAVARMTFKTDHPSVPEFPHVHTLVKLGHGVPPVPANTLVWAGSEPDQGEVKFQLV